MRFIVDECTGTAVGRWLTAQGHDVFSVFEQARGMTDEQVIQTAIDDKRILITNDKDFGEKVFREQQTHYGVVLMRLDDERAANKIDVLSQLLVTYADRLANQFVVVTESRVRFAKSRE